MDIKKEIKPTNSGMKYWIFAGVFLSLLLGYKLIAQANDNYMAKDLIIAPVKAGSLDIVVDGFGVLVSNNQRLITARVSGSVVELLQKPGSASQSDDVILRLENVEVMQSVENEKMEVALMEADLRQLKISHQREISIDINAIENLNLQLKATINKLDLIHGLDNSGAISKMEYQRIELEKELLEQNLKYAQKQLLQRKLAHQELLAIQEERVNQQKSKLNLIIKNAQSLDVTSGINGVIQQLYVELGQNVMAGEKLCLVGDDKNLLALIKVPQHQAQKIKIGQLAIVDTRQDKVSGKVTRIDASVIDNTVTVEVALPLDLPLSARPQSNVDATIIIDKLPDVKYIERPVGVQEFGKYQLFKVKNDIGVATELTFGGEAGKYIQIVDGAEVNDQFVISSITASATKKINIR